jgi:pilus biogenesis lipoprotein CpaD
MTSNFQGLMFGVALAAFTLTGCNPPVIQEWSGLEQPVRLSVQNVHLRQSVAFVAGTDRVRDRDSGALRTFVERQRPEPRDVVVIAQTPPQGPRATDIANARARALSNALAGTATRMLDVRQTYDPSVPANTAEIRIARAVVQLPACGDWTRPPNATFANGPNANFGCATAYNLGAMVADPTDLAGGRTIGPAFGEHQVPAVQRYNRGQVTPLPETTTSNIGGGGSAAPTASTSGAQQ